jgi:hypothetical protein
VWLPCGPGEDTKRCERTRARTAHLSELTHLALTFEPGMGQLDHACLFVSGEMCYPYFSIRTDTFKHAVIVWIGQLKIPLRYCWVKPTQFMGLFGSWPHFAKPKYG